MDVEVEFTGGTGVGKAGSGEAAGIAEEGTRGVGGVGDEGERMRRVRGVVQGAGSMEALFVEKEFALPAGVEGDAG